MITNKTICIIQVTRFGDLVQTLQAAAALREEHPSIRLLLIARAQFAKPLNFLLEKTFDKIFLLESKELLQESPSNLTALNSFLAPLEEENISALVNLSYSRSSSYLASIVPADHKLGPHYDDHANLIIKDKWSQYVYSNVLGGPLNPFSLVDLFKFILGSKHNSYKRSSSDGRKDIVTIHPFASLSKKHWKPHKWRDIIYKLLKDNPKLIINLVGSEQEKSDSFKIIDSPILGPFSDRIINHVGKTSLHELYDLLGETKLFLGHDSMVGHLASLHGLPIISIPLGCVRPIETAPFGDNTISLSPRVKCFPCFPDTACDHMQCHADIPYQVVTSSVQQLLMNGELSKNAIESEISHFHLTSVDISSTSFSAIEKLQMKGIIDEPSSMKHILKTFFRITWLYLLGETEEYTTFPKLSQKTHQELLTYLPGVQHIFELCEFGKKYCRFILEEVSGESPNLAQIRAYSHKVDEIDKLMTSLKNNFPGLTPIIDYYSIIKGNTAGVNVVELTQHSFLNYDEIASAVSIIYELIEKTIAENKIHSSKTSQRSL